MWWDIIGLLSWIWIWICFLDIIEDKYGYEKKKWDIFLGYLFWDTISNHILIIKRYPNISYHILSYPFISFHILKYPRGRTPRCRPPGKWWRRWCGIVSVSPTGTTGSFPRILWIGITYIIGFLWSSSYTIRKPIDSKLISNQPK
jgi:hypothetical protein